MLQQYRRKWNNRLCQEMQKQSRKELIQHGRRVEKRRHPTENKQEAVCRSRMAAVLEEEEGVDAIVQNKNIALLKIRGLIDVGGRKIFSFVVSQLTNGGVFVSIVVVMGRKLTNIR